MLPMRTVLHGNPFVSFVIKKYLLNLDVARLVLGVSVSETFTFMNAIQFNNL